MNHGRIGLQPDLVARVELMTLAEHGHDLLTAELRKNLRLGIRRLALAIAIPSPSSRPLRRCAGRRLTQRVCA